MQQNTINSNEQDIQKKEKKYTFDDYALIIVIGKGAFGKVLLVKNKVDKRIYAMKILKKKDLKNEKQVENVISERNILVKVRHPFIIRLQQSFQNKEKLYFILEYCPGGDLYNLLRKRKKFTEDQTRFYAAQILLAIEELHKQNIIYRDQNQNESIAQSMCGTPEYIAPEIIQKQGYSKPIDWWAYGCLIFEMLTGLPPFISNNLNDLFNKIIHCELVYPENMTKHCLDLLKKLLAKDPKNRIGTQNGAEEIKSHKWFSNLDFQNLYDQLYAPPFTPLIKSDLDVRNFNREFTEININSVNSKTPQSQINTKHYLGFSYMGSTQKEDLGEDEEDDNFSTQQQQNQEQIDEKEEEQEDDNENQY
ncbi:Protein kinase-like domain [Pseudocohnilembus persalinus]|uniref:non-specific serine/threonine protein kinase n=1 Tax=Pseudocohnilembus persalinus TaxID=266149 RepID=A0A0V0QLV9_PSEPJ|nr:Protein kinase-like domain [Pseudocohnilembus persalinus]|eukprot:KRX02976.1 Protein kinase-like domain [Pseudocohnilembus persalinus]